MNRLYICAVDTSSSLRLQSSGCSLNAGNLRSVTAVLLHGSRLQSMESLKATDTMAPLSMKWEKCEIKITHHQKVRLFIQFECLCDNMYRLVFLTHLAFNYLLHIVTCAEDLDISTSNLHLRFLKYASAYYSRLNETRKDDKIRSPDAPNKYFCLYLSPDQHDNLLEENVGPLATGLCYSM